MLRDTAFIVSNLHGYDFLSRLGIRAEKMVRLWIRPGLYRVGAVDEQDNKGSS